MMRTLLFATAAITVLAVAAPAFARGHFRITGITANMATAMPCATASPASRARE